MTENRGHFKKGEDERRHTFTREECQRGFQAAEQSIARRYPGADAHFLMCAMIGSRPMTEILLEMIEAGLVTPDMGDAEILARFGRD